MSMKIWKWLLSWLWKVSSNHVNKKKEVFFCRFIQRFDDFHQQKKSSIQTHTVKPSQRPNQFTWPFCKSTTDVVYESCKIKANQRNIKPVTHTHTRDREKEKTNVTEEFSHQYNVSCRLAHDKCCTLFGFLLALLLLLLLLAAGCWNIVYHIFISQARVKFCQVHTRGILSRLSQRDRE